MSRRLNVAAVLFDFYNTLVSIATDEGDQEVWERLARFVRYHGLQAEAELLRQQFFAAAEEGQRLASEAYPETDVYGIFSSILAALAALAEQPLEQLTSEVVKLFRTLSMRHFELFPETLEALDSLHHRFRLGLVTDAQPLFVSSEIDMVGLRPYFDVIVVSGESGFHKPDTRLFEKALEGLNVGPSDAAFVGDSVSRDICGAEQAGLNTVLLDRDLSYYHLDAPCTPDLVIRQLLELNHLLLPGSRPRGRHA